MKTKRTIGALMLALVMVLSLGLTACGPKTVKFTVTFESNGGTSVAALTVEDGGKIAEPTAPAKADCDFAGWYKDAALGTEWKFDVDTVTADTTLYAKWTPYEQFAVTFETGDGSAVAGLTVTKGHTITKPTDPTLAKHRFDGWFKEAACTNAWNFDTDKVTAAVTLYAKWTRVEAGTIAWVTPEAGSVVVPSDYGLYNPDYRLTLEDFAPDVYATEDGERLPTIIAAADETFAYDETTRLLTPGNYTVAYEALDSVNGTHEETFDVVVKDAEEINYYVYVNKVGAQYIDTKWEEILGARIRIAYDKYFVSPDGTLPAQLINPHDPTLIVDFDDAYVLKNEGEIDLTVSLSDKSGVYAVFDQSGKVIYGVDGFQNKGISAAYPFENSTKGYTQKNTVTIPADCYMLAVGNSPNGNWYYNTAQKTTWNPDAVNPSTFSSDGRAFVYTSVMPRYGNMIQFKKGAALLTDAYTNQAPYMSAGYADAEIVIGSAKPTAESLIGGVTFRDDNGTFAVDDDITVTNGDATLITVTDESYAAFDVNTAGTYGIVFEVTDPTDNTVKARFTKNFIVFVPTQYMKIGNKYLNAPNVQYNHNYGDVDLPGNNTVSIWDTGYTDAASTIPKASYTVYIVINKTTGKLIEAQDWSKLYHEANPNGTDLTSATNREGARLRFATLTDDELLIVFSQGAVRDFGVAVINAAKGDAFATTFIQIADLAGFNIPVVTE